MADILGEYIPDADPYPDLPYHIAYSFSGGRSEDVGSARCRGCNETWRRESEFEFREWYREHRHCSELLQSSSTSG